MKILALFLSLFICKFTFSQLDSNKFRLSIGANIHADMFNVNEFITYGNGTYSYNDYIKYGGGVDIRMYYQNKWFLSSFSLGINEYPFAQNEIVNNELKQAFNLCFYKKDLKTFVGPFVSLGFNYASKKQWDFTFSEKLVSNIGLVYSRKYFQIEVSKMFRKKSFEEKSFDRFIWGYTFSLGVKIPLKKIQKK